MTAEELLDLLAENRSMRDVLILEKTAKSKALIPSEIQVQLDALEVEFAENIAVIDNLITDLESQVRELTIEKGATVKGRYLMAIWNKGRSGGWDNGKLEGFAMAYPAILAAKKPDGEPTVSIREIGK